MTTKKFDMKAYQKQWRIDNREYIKVRRVANKDVWNANRRKKSKTEENILKRKEYVRIHAKEIQDAVFKRKYGISLDSYILIAKKQKNRCKICGINPSKTKHKLNQHSSKCKLVVDHNHRTGKVRGLLCPNCNRALGFFGDNPNTVHEAFNYLIND